MLERQLSIAQDCIGGVERKASLLETENQKIQTELQFWNEVYQQGTAISHTASALPFVNQPCGSIPLPTSIPYISVASMQTAMSMEIPMVLSAYIYYTIVISFTRVLNFCPGGASYECKHMG